MLHNIIKIAKKRYVIKEIPKKQFNFSKNFCYSRKRIIKILEKIMPNKFLNKSNKEKILFAFEKLQTIDFHMGLIGLIILLTNVILSNTTLIIQNNAIGIGFDSGFSILTLILGLFLIFYVLGKALYYFLFLSSLNGCFRPYIRNLEDNQNSINQKNLLLKNLESELEQKKQELDEKEKYFLKIQISQQKNKKWIDEQKIAISRKQEQLDKKHREILGIFKRISKKKNIARS